MSAPSTALSDRERKLRGACADLERRLQLGEANVLEEIFSSDPELAADEDSAIELIYNEFLVREELGKAPAPDELSQRFPRWQDRLNRLLKVHEVFRPEEIPNAHRDTLLAPEETNSAQSSNTPAAAATRRIGQYTVIAKIASGGMGVVYKARQHGLNRLVALKVIRCANASDSERERFRIEAEATARLQHPHIVPIYEVGEEDGCEFLSMEFVEGGSLEHRLATGSLSPRESAELVATLAEAMQFAHERGVVHRDLKPGNVLLAADNHPKIADFGLAKRLFEESGRQTNTGAILGTPCYMAPEQAEGRNSLVGPATDVYALGTILYQSLTGQPPFQAETPLQTLDMIRLRDPVAPSRLNPKTPADLETICLACLQKEPSQRYVSAQALADDLRRFLEHEPILARPIGRLERGVRWIRRHPLISGLCALLLIVLGLFTGVVSWQQRRVGELATVTETTRRSAEDSQQRAKQAKAEAADSQQRALAATAEAENSQHRAQEAEAAAEASFKKAKELVDRWSRFGQQLMYEPGMGEVSDKALQEALRHYEAFLKQRGSDPQLEQEVARACERAGMIQMELGRFDSAEKTLQRGVEVYNSWRAEGTEEVQRCWDLCGMLTQLGHAQRRLERWPASEESYRRAISLLHALLEQRPENNGYATRLANVLLNLCVTLNSQARYEECEQAYLKAIRLQMDAIRRDVQLPPLTESSTAIDAADKKTESKVLILEAERAKRLREELGQLPVHVLTSLARKGYLLGLALGLDDAGDYLSRRNSWRASETALREGLELRILSRKYSIEPVWSDSYLARSYSHLANVLDRKGDYEGAAGQYREAITLLERSAAEFPERVDFTNGLGRSYRQMADSLRRNKKFDEAQQFYRMSLTRMEQFLAKSSASQVGQQELANTYLEMGNSWQRLREYPRAIEADERACQLAPDNARTWNNLAWLLTIVPDESQRNPRRALQCAKESVRLSAPSHARFNTLGVAHYRMEQYEEAISCLEQAMALADGGDPADWYFLAMSHARLHDREQAVRWFDKATDWLKINRMEYEDEVEVMVAEAKAVMAGQ